MLFDFKVNSTRNRIVEFGYVLINLLLFIYKVTNLVCEILEFYLSDIVEWLRMSYELYCRNIHSVFTWQVAKKLCTPLQHNENQNVYAPFLPFLRTKKWRSWFHHYIIDPPFADRKNAISSHSWKCESATWWYSSYILIHVSSLTPPYGSFKEVSIV